MYASCPSDIRQLACKGDAVTFEQVIRRTFDEESAGDILSQNHITFDAYFGNLKGKPSFLRGGSYAEIEAKVVSRFNHFSEAEAKARGLIMIKEELLWQHAWNLSGYAPIISATTLGSTPLWMLMYAINYYQEKRVKKTLLTRLKGLINHGN